MGSVRREKLNKKYSDCVDVQQPQPRRRPSPITHRQPTPTTTMAAAAAVDTAPTARRRGRVATPPTTTPTAPSLIARCLHPLPVAATEPGQQQRKQQQQQQQQQQQRARGHCTPEPVCISFSNRSENITEVVL